MDRDLRSIVAWFVHFLNGLAVMAGTLFIGSLYLKAMENEKSLQEMRHNTGIALVVGVVLVVANILRLLYLRRTGGEGEDYILSQSATGESVRVAVEAIRSELKSAVEEIIEVSRCKISVIRSGPKRVRIHASYIACEGTRILDISEQIRVVIRERFQEMVPLGEGVRQEIEIDFESFGGKPSKKGALEPEEAPKAPPFTGPKYPVDGEIR